MLTQEKYLPVQSGNRSLPLCSYTWDDAVSKWLSEKDHKASLKSDIMNFQWLKPRLTGVPLHKITRDVVEAIRAEKLSTGVTNATVNRLLALLRSVLRKAAIEWEWIDRAPHVRLMKEPKRRVRFLTREEAVRLLAELPEHVRDMAAFTLATGLRRANVTGLLWEQVNLAQRVAWIYPDQAKARKAIPVPLNDDAYNIIARQKTKHETHVFTYKGNPVSQPRNGAWLKALKRAGIENFRWHDLRHTWASWHAQSGTPLSVLQELGGWESVEMVQRYAHLSVAHLTIHANNLNSLFCLPNR